MSSSSKIYLGKFTLSGFVVAEHWAVCVDHTWYEVAGISKLDKGNPNEIVSHQNSSKYSRVKLLGSMVPTAENVEQWNAKWLKTHPNYSVNGDNCQLYVKDFVKYFLDADLDTQNWTVGRAMAGAGIVTVLFGVAATLIGVYIQGTHEKGHRTKDEEKDVEKVGAS